MKSDEIKTFRRNDIAIVGWAGRFPGADNIEEFWQIIKEGRETVTFYSREELIKKGVEPELLDNPAYVPADSIVESADKFDSSFFGYSPREADFMDPQHRVFLEECYSALENAGYDPEKYKGEIGIFAGCSRNNYWLKNLSQHFDILSSIGELQTIVNNDKDFLTTRVSYKLNLTGPSVDIQTACSTSLVAIHFACQSLITAQCDMALAGGVFVKNPRGEGYIFEEGNIDSPTGKCYPFDKEAEGTVFGEGAGVVVLKRLGDAVTDRDNIIAVIKATAINNDGSLKVGYMAPGVSGQAKVISKAIEMADIDPSTIGYIEAHGTGTRLGDPIEIESLSRAFGDIAGKTQFCALGSVKANIGHLDAAAGVTGLIKAALVLKKQAMPPMVNYTSPNPELNLENSPFYVNRNLKEWQSNSIPRRSAVSSFGIGGTNGHAILEEWLMNLSRPSPKRFHLLPLSAKSNSALEKMYENLLTHLSESNYNIADVAFTLQNGRKEFKNRGMLLWDTAENGDQIFSKLPFFRGARKLSDPKTVFMFTGQGSQYVNMARGLYDHFESFRTIINFADAFLKEYHNLNLTELLFTDSEENRELLNQTSAAQPALFVVQFAIANLLMEFGIMPDAMTGHSIGEITAACISGVFGFEDALNLVATRGRLMQEQQPGSMLSINLSRDEVTPLLSSEVEISLSNAPNFCVVSGTFKAIDKFEKILLKARPECRITRLKTSHAFHSKMMEPVIEPFREILQKTEFQPINIPFISNVTGTWIRNDEATDPDYWTRHIRSMVNFSDGISELLKDENSIFVEVGPGNTLSMLLSQFQTQTRLSSVLTGRHPKQSANDAEFFLNSVANFWIEGGRVSWQSIYADEERYRVPLPSYPFERTRHWIEAAEKYSYHVKPKHAQYRAVSTSNAEPSEIEAIQKSNEFYHERPKLDNDCIPAESTIESRITSIWEELLGIRNICVADNFFHLGGHSLLASQIINRINEEFGTALTMEKFFNNPTIRGLMEGEEVKDSKTPAVPEELKPDYQSALPLSNSQERLWIINQIDNNTPAYNLAFSYIFNGELDKKIFRESMEIFFDRHKIMKSIFKTGENGPEAFIKEDSEVGIREADFSDVPASEQNKKIQEYLQKETLALFDIENGPLYRISLINLGNEKILFHFTIHHLIFDGWSWGIFTRELSDIYNRLASGKKIKSEPQNMDYFEYALIEQNEDPAIRFKDAKGYWKKKLAGISGHLNFPSDFRRKEVSSGEGGRVAINIGAGLTESIKVYAKKENITLYMFFLSLFGFILGRYSGDKDICVGTPTANRRSSNLEKLIGLFINSIVLRLQIDEEMSFPEFLRTVKSVSLEALSHQELPFEELVELIQPERVMNVNPLFQVMFAWQNAPRPPLDLVGIKSERVFQEEGVSPLDMTFYAWEENGSITGEFEFSKDVFKRSTIESLKENFIYLLDQVVNKPDQRLKELSIVSDFEKQRISIFNNTSVLVPEAGIHSLFEQKVTEFPGKEALLSLSTGNSVTYTELESRANQLAHYLHRRGFRQGDISGISMSRTETMVVAVLAVLKAGGTYLPLDPAFPDERLLYMLKDSGARFLITEEQLKERFNGVILTTIAVDTEQIAFRKESRQAVERKADPDSLAYIIYTSGSTGKPKGVKVHHRAVVNFIRSMAKEPGLSPDDRLLAVTTLSFDISVLELFLPLSTGATIILADNTHTADGEVLAKILDEHHIAVLQATPTTWTLLLASGWKGNKYLKALCGGEALLPGLAKNIISKVDSLWNMYGPTETTVWSSFERITDHNRILVGKPIDNTQFHIIQGLQEQPVGATGELCIGGFGVSKGYHNREELNKEKFISWNGQQVYRTGDLARFNDEGKIELLGRNDNQIKLRGFRIEPGEIEFQLSTLEGVREAVVKTDVFGDEDIRLVGFLNVTGGFKFDRDQIVKSMENKLPAYMIPGSYMILNEFPRTLNGKIDRKSLKFNNSEQADDKYETEFLTESEKSIEGILLEILKLKNIRKKQNFFDIGGNSLLGLRVINKIKEKLGITLSFRDLITNPTLRQLGSLIETKSESHSGRINLVHLDENGKLPLTGNQKRLWVISQMHRETPLYIIEHTYQLSGSLESKLFIESLGILFRKHKIVSAVFNDLDGEPYCIIRPSDVNVSFLDYSGLPELDRSAKLASLINSNSKTPFDLEEGPLYRMFLVKTATDEYYFNLSIHHIVFDGWSWSVLVEDLQKIYNGLLKNGDADPGVNEFEIYDYAQWENSVGEGENKEELIAFWNQYLEGASTILNFPYDFPRKEERSGKGSYEIFSFTKEVSDKFRNLSNTEGVSLFSTLLGVFGVQLSRYTSDDDINVGFPIAHRPHSSLETIFGMFVNTVVVRLRYNEDLTFNNVIHAANDSAHNAIAHQELPFENVVEIVNPQRSSNTNPVFQVAFDWLKNLDMPIELEGVTGRRIPEKERTTPFDLTMYLWENGDIIEGEIEYSTDILAPDSIRRFSENFINLASSLIESPDKKISEISLLSNADKENLSEFNNTEVPVPGILIQNLFEKQAELKPKKTALICGDTQLTYQKADHKANQLARYLIASGMKQGDIAGIYLDRSEEMVIAALAVLKAGGCYLPADPSFPDERVKHMISDSGAKYLISESSFEEKLASFSGISKVLIDKQKKEIGLYPTDKPEIKIDPDSLAYIIYTSGSTGKPKGVRVHHKPVVNLIQSMTTTPGLKENDILLAVTTLSFDMSVFELFVPLSNGATIVVAGSRDVTDGSSLIRLIEKREITLIQATPSFWSLLLSTGWRGSKSLKAMCGGEALTTGLIRQVLPKVGELWNCYGPTETTVYSTCARILSDELPVLIGKPINNTQIQIWDKKGRILPVGVIGEVVIGGMGITKEYHNRPDLSAEKFIHQKDGEVFYKTGDLGRFRNDGNVELFGRSDNQIKLRGFRIEPGEIENLLTALPEVREAVVKLHKFGEGDDRLVAYVNAGTDFTLNRKELQKYVSRHLPAYMIPSLFQVHDGFPRLPNGKINKKALMPEKAKPKIPDEKYFESLPGTQKQLLNIWKTLLKVSDLTINDNFFDVGGNSLLTIKLINIIREELGLELTFRELVSNPTIARLSEYSDSLIPDGNKVPDLVHLPGLTNLPLTTNQKRLWLISRLHRDIASYIITYSYKLKGNLNPELLMKSLEVLFNRHIIVFSVFREKGGEPYSDIVPSQIKYEFSDFSELPEMEKQEKVRELIDADSLKPFDLENGPLYRLYLIKTSTDKYYFHFSIHHIIFDGWSWPVFVRDLSRIYSDMLAGKEAKLQKLEFQQYDFAPLEERLAKAKDRKALEVYWKENLRGAPSIINFPWDFPRKERASGIGRVEKICIPRELSEKFREFAISENTSLFSTLLGAFGLQLNKYTGENDVNIGMPVAYRPHTGLEDLFGMFVNTLVIRLRQTEDLSFRSMVNQANEVVLNAITHQDLSLNEIVDLINPVRSVNINPLFQAAFVWQNNLDEPIVLEGIKSERMSGTRRTTAFDLTLYLWENGKIIEGEIEYSADLLTPETVRRFRNNFLNLLKNLVDNADIPVSSLSLITKAEKEKIAGFNNTITQYPREKTIATLFEEQVTLFPGKIAVVFNEHSFTYKQLNERSNQLAGTLRNHGVEKNTPVGLLAEKSADIIIGMLGILKAGGVYVPIDPDYPEQRINFIITDAGCKILLTQDKYLTIPVEGIEIISLNSESSFGKVKKNPDCINDALSQAYIMYTSGTTGKPKGSIISQRGVVRLVRNVNYMELTSDDRILMTGAIVFDASTFEIWGALLNGGTLYIAEKETILNYRALGAELEKHNITILWLTSALFTQLAEAGTGIFRKLKYLLSGGDVLSARHINKVRNQNPGLKVINGYGPTENTAFSTTYLIQKDFDYNIPIGSPVSNSTTYIFDRKMNYQPIGVIGELYVGGDGVSLGYVNRDDLNARSFIYHPFVPGERLYKTGDFAKWLPDGTIEFHGRIDNQLKIRGFRVELDEIESVITETGGVIETIIKPIKDREGDKRLVAFLNVPEEVRIDLKELESRLRKKLPPYMIPSSFKIMHGFPATINGKTDRNALIPDQDIPVTSEEIDVSSFSPTEMKIYLIWSEVLKTKDISLTDNFFEIGGNSLMAISVFSRIESAFDSDLGLRVFFDSPRIKDLADFIDIRTSNLLTKEMAVKEERSDFKIVEGDI